MAIYSLNTSTNEYLGTQCSGIIPDPKIWGPKERMTVKCVDNYFKIHPRLHINHDQATSSSDSISHFLDVSQLIMIYMVTIKKWNPHELFYQAKTHFLRFPKRLLNHNITFFNYYHAFTFVFQLRYNWHTTIHSKRKVICKVLIPLEPSPPSRPQIQSLFPKVFFIPFLI